MSAESAFLPHRSIDLRIDRAKAGANQNDPVMIRAYAGQSKGATAFFRNRFWLDSIVEALRERVEQRPRIFFHACSIGAEPYSLALWYLHRFGEASESLPEIEATDIEPSFLELARRGVYPKTVLEGMTAEERSWFDVVDKELVRVPEPARKLVHFRKPQSFLTPIDGDAFDAISIMNALTYVSPLEQSTAIKLAARNSRHILGLSAFHPDSIKLDIDCAGFTPLVVRLREIHEAWGDRCTLSTPVAGTPEYSWQLPPFATPVPDRNYRFASLFVRQE